MYGFSHDKDVSENIGEIVLDTLLSSDIDSITYLNFGVNSCWFKNPKTQEERTSNIELLMDLIYKQTGL